MKRVEISFEMKYDWRQVNDFFSALAKLNKGKCTDSGASFGVRDMGFYFEKEDDARTFKMICMFIFNKTDIRGKCREIEGDDSREQLLAWARKQQRRV